MANDFEKKFLDPERMPPSWPWRIFAFSLALLSLSIVFYLGLRLGYRSFLGTQIDDKDSEIAALAESVPVEEQRALIKFYSQLANLQEILNQHVIVAKVFPLLEKYTNKKVYHNGLNLNTKTREMVLDSVADSYEILAQELEAFKQAPEVERLVINNSGVKDNKINFQLLLTLKESVLR